MVKIARVARLGLLVFLVVFIGAQAYRPDRSNPPSTPGASLRALATPEVAAILDRSCRDCHSNETRWPWYSNVSPTSWLVANHVHHGREHFNYSQWTSIDEDEQDSLLGGMCSLTERERMPLPSYLLLHRGSKLSPADVKTLCAWSEKMRDMLQ
ncbi:MAG: heme-binding domain-containing protein [Thermoanaerobaculia bacterium]